MARKEGSDQIGGIPIGSFLDRDIVIKVGGLFVRIPQNEFGTVIRTAPGPHTASTASEILGDSSGGSFVLNLPAASSTLGRIYTVIKTDSSINTITVTPAGLDTINNSATYVLNTQYQSVQLLSDGVGNWVIRAGFSPAVAPSAGTLVISGLTTAGLAAGDCGYISANNTLSKTDAANINTSRMHGVNNGVAGEMIVGGLVTINFVTGLTLNAGDPVWLAVAPDAGKVTNVAPITGIDAQIGVVQDQSDYAGLQKSKVVIQVKTPVVL